jgi:vitamin B12 transporter
MKWIICLFSIFALAGVEADENFIDDIEEILVQASLLPISSKRSANAITIINSDQIKNRTVLSISDLLRDVPGLAVSKSGVQGSQTQIRVRGSEANHLLVIIDGIEANNSAQSDEFRLGHLDGQ